MGSPLGNREAEGVIEAEVNKHLNGLIELIPKVYGNTEPCRQAVAEVAAMAAMQDTMCKRAMLLYGLSKERDICEYWKSHDADGSAALAEDLHSRVLPFVVPRFFKHSCQSPDAFVIITMLLSEMWGGEKLGNWPRVP